MKKKILKFIIVFLVLNVLFAVFSTLVCILPTKNIKKNIEKSIPTLAKEGNYPYAIINEKRYQMDNFTDEIMLGQNYIIDSKKPFISVMNVTVLADAVKAIQQQKSSDLLQRLDYTRYWFGNTFLLRLLLFFTDYGTIRWLLYAISFMLMLVLGAKLCQCLGMIKMLAFFIGFVFVNIYVTQFSMQFFSTVIISIIATTLICKHFKNKQKIFFISFVTGCITSYFDLLTTPLLTCGLPLIIYISLKTDESLRIRLITLFLFITLWAIGYSFTWATKWTLATLFTGINVFKDAFNAFIVRTNIENLFSYYDVIKFNFNLLQKFFIYVVLILLSFIALLFFNKKALKTNILLLIVATFPFLWFLVVAQHSALHCWFTYRIQAISIIALFYILINFISFDKLNRSLRGKNERLIEKE